MKSRRLRRVFHHRPVPVACSLTAALLQLLLVWGPATMPTSSCAFFDFFGKRPEVSEDAKSDEPKTVSYRQMTMLQQLRRSREVEARWADFCKAASRSSTESVSTLPASFVEPFLLDPNNHDVQLLKGFIDCRKLGPVKAPQSEMDDLEEELGGFMSSSRYGLVKSEDWRLEEKRLHVERVLEHTSKSDENLASWTRFCLQEWVDPDDEESQAVRDEMGMRSELGNARKTPLEAWYHVESGKPLPGQKRKYGA